MRGDLAWLKYCMLILCIGLCIAIPLRIEAANRSHNGKDYVAINKITPCTGADIPTPCKFPITMELTYKMVTASKGTLRVGVFLRQPGSKAKNIIKSKLGNLQPLLPYIEKSVSKGTSTLTISTDPVNIPKATGHNSQLIVVVNVQDSAKKELCWATSFNFLRGNISVRSDGKTPARDSLQVMSYTPLPKAGPLYTGRSHSFDINMQYNLRSKNWAFVNLEFCDQANDTDKGVWYIVAIPLSKGSGTVKVKTRDFFMPVSFSGRQLMLHIPFRVDPLGGTLNILNFGPWPLQRPQP